MNTNIYKKYLSPANVEIAAGWFVTLVALATYLLTLEPSVSYWDCGEYIMSGTLLEAGHPPGNPIWMLTARFFANFAVDTQHVPLMVNAMSAVLSALTVLLVYRIIVLMFRFVVNKKDDEENKGSFRGVLCGVAGALVLCWSDSFWYSAVEAEVYAYASFLTALTLWLALKRRPGDNRMLVLLAYLTGLSLGVHLLCLLTLPALVLVMAYRKQPDLKTSKAALVVAASFVPVFFILYGLMPGALALAQQFELLCVNTIGLPYNSGVLIYVVSVLLLFVAVVAVVRNSNNPGIRICVTASALFISGITCVAGNLIVGAVFALLAAVGLNFLPKLMQREGRGISVDNLKLKITTVLWCVVMLFIGYSAYALMLVRGTQHTPHSQENIDNIFALQRYISREQYGSSPLFYGKTPYARKVLQRCEGGVLRNFKQKKSPEYVRNTPGVTPRYRNAGLTSADSAENLALYTQSSRKDYYIRSGYNFEYVTTPELNMPLTRIHSDRPAHIASYASWAGMTPDAVDSVEVTTMIDSAGNPLPKTGLRLPRPTLLQHLRFFAGYQVGYMYFRYLMWNFVGRQNDLLSQGQADAGNFITGFDPLDSLMTGDTDRMPADVGKKNPGRNIYFGLPLLLGLTGIAWLLNNAKGGKQIFWIVMTLFLLTGLAIVIFLNQTPNEPRERDYSFIGSFMAFAIWCGFGVMYLCETIEKIQAKMLKRVSPRAATLIAGVVAVAIPLQMLSQTYDDHNRSRRTAAHDFSSNYLNLCEPNAILFTDGDNFTFPLWYVHDVEGVRADVRIVNLSYLYSTWYVNQLLIDDKGNKALPTTFTAKQLAYGQMNSARIVPGGRRDAIEVLKETYREAAGGGSDYPCFRADTVLIAPQTPGADSIAIAVREITNGSGNMNGKHLVMLDILATNAAQGWKRPVYWTENSGVHNRLGLAQYIEENGPVVKLTDFRHGNDNPVYNYSRLVQLTENGTLQWGGAGGDNRASYYGPEAAHIAAVWRRALTDAAEELVKQGKKERAIKLAQKIEREFSTELVPFTIYASHGENAAEGIKLGQVYIDVAEQTGNAEMLKHGKELQQQHIRRIKAFKHYAMSLPCDRREYVSRETLKACRFRLK